MQAVSKNSLEQLALRSKELDAREQYIITREALAVGLDGVIAEAEHRRKTLDSQCTALDSLVAEKRQLITQAEKQLASLEKTYTATADKLRAKLVIAEDLQRQSAEKLKRTKTEHAQILQAIAERKEYQHQQEAVIDQCITDGRGQIRDLEYQVLDVTTTLKKTKEQLVEVKKDSRNLEEDKALAADGFKQITDGYEAQEATLQARVTHKQQELDDLDARVAAATEDYAAVVAQTAAKHKQLEVKEQAILAKREALRAELEDMQYQKRRHTSVASLYDVE